MNKFSHGGEAVSGKEGKVFVIIDGVIHDFAMCKDINFDLDKSKTELKVIGKRFTMHKTGGVTGTGSMTIYDCIPQLRALAVKYITTGVDVYFRIVTVNDDPTSSSGKQTMSYNYVNLDSTVMSQLNSDTDALETSVDFTYEDVTPVTSFNS